MIRITIVAALVVLSPFSLATVRRSMPPNSFLDYKVYSSGALIQELDKHPAVASKYMRHFQLNLKELRVKFAELHLDKLKSDAVYSVFSVPKDGRIKVHQEKLKAGMPVFADRHHHAILLVKCGNPVTYPLRQALYLPKSMKTSYRKSLKPTSPDTSPVLQLPATQLSEPKVPEATPELMVETITPMDDVPNTPFSGVQPNNAPLINPLIPGSLIAGALIYGQEQKGSKTPPVPEVPNCCFLAFGICGIGFLSHIRKGQKKLLREPLVEDLFD